MGNRKKREARNYLCWLPVLIFGGWWVWVEIATPANDSLHIPAYWGYDATVTIVTDTNAIGSDTVAITDTIASHDSVFVFADHQRLTVTYLIMPTGTTDTLAWAWTADGRLANLDAAISGVSGGGGATTYRIRVWDNSDSSTLNGVRVNAWNSTQTTLQASGITNASGILSLDLTTGDTMDFVASATGYSFSCSTAVVAANDSVIMEGTAHSVSAPSGSHTCTCYGYLYNIPAEKSLKYRTVWFELEKAVADTCNDVIPVELVASTQCNDTTGYFEIELVKSYCIGSTAYRMTVEGMSGSLQVTVPDSATYRIKWTE